nr:MAG TPA: hypothetical protein [Caudoviricetes sp.]
MLYISSISYSYIVLLCAFINTFKTILLFDLLVVYESRYTLYIRL